MSASATPEGPPSSAPPSGDLQGTARAAAEPWLAFAAATAIASALYWTARGVPLLDENLHGLIAVVFLYVPALASRLSGVAFSYEEAGLRLRPFARPLLILAAVGAVTWPLFFAAFLSFYGAVCAGAPPAWLSWWGAQFGAPCVRWRGLSGASLTWPPGLFFSLLAQLVVVAVPEELFFRGYLLGRFERRWPSRRLVLGARVGWPLLASSGLFALGHVLVDFDVGRLAVFFPALVFGWMRARTGTIVAGALFHAACNVLSDVLHRSFF